MGNKGGLPSVPRGLAQELTLYLQALDGLVHRMAGMVRGTVQETDAARSTVAALRSRTTSAGTAAASCVGTDQLMDGAVGTKQLKRKAVTTDILAANAVTESKLRDGAVSKQKLADGIVPEWSEGTAQDGEEINLGAWAGRPALCVAGFDLPFPGAAWDSLSVGFDDLRHDGTVWRCTARARLESAGAETPVSQGSIRWQIVGKRA